MKMKHQLAAVCVAAMAAVSAQAQTATATPAVYVGGSIGQSKWRGDADSSADTTTTGGKLYAGYEFSPNFALELGYADLGKFNSDDSSLKVNGPYLDAVGKLPFSPSWAGLIRAGFFQGKADADVLSDSGTGYKYGIGAQYNLSPVAGIRVEYERYTLKVFDTKPDTDLVSVGFNYRF